jgi:trimethylamine:corrinoid methyltransferase-like protein
MDSKKKYFDLLGKKDPNELYNLISGSGGNAEAIAAEAIMLLQARGVVAGGVGGCGEATITNTKKITFSNREMNNVIESDNYTPEEKIKAIEDKERLEVERARMRTEYFKSQVINNENKNGGVN